MLEELQNLPPDGAAPDQGTQSEDGAASVLEDAESSEEESADGDAHPEVPTEGGEKAESPTPFHVEGGRQFQTKEEYIKYVNKQRGAASVLATEKKNLESRLAILEAQLTEAATNSKKQEEPEEQIGEDQIEALKTIKKHGKFLTVDELQQILDSRVEARLAKVEGYSLREEQRQFEEAQSHVGAFLEANPDANEIREELADTIDKLEKAGIAGGIDKAYLLLTGKQPLKQPIAKQEAEKRSIKRAQATGSPNSSSGAARVEQDELSKILNW